jgi:hypothetical protein
MMRDEEGSNALKAMARRHHIAPLPVRLRGSALAVRAAARFDSGFGPGLGIRD